VPVALPALAQKLKLALDPKKTLVAGVGGRLEVSPDLGWTPADPLEPVMAYPKLERPMYEPLRDRGQDWLLPGLAEIPVNTVTLVVTNQRFIEAYMVGLNHEMARELLWNEYPTDQRGSYFRQFWDVTGLEPAPADPESVKDIREIHRWPEENALGANSARPPLPPGENRVVLLVRGDLLRRYPNTEVYALAAVAGANGRRNLGSERRNPIFRGSLRPDVAFFGFELTPAQALAGQGWFFVLEEQPAEPRFGLDVAGAFGAPLTRWNDLSWGHLAASAENLASLRHIDLDAALPDTRPLDASGEPAWHADSGLGRTGTQSADLAFVTLQRPVRIAIHATDMLRGLA
jgi:hypothetical protein